MSLIRVQSAMTFLVTGLKAYFLDVDVGADVHFGVRAYFEIFNQGAGGAARVVIVPGSFDGAQSLKSRSWGHLGTKLGHAQINPREVAHWVRPITFAIWAQPDLTGVRDEILQNERTEALFEATVAGVRTVAMADVVFGEVERVSPPQEYAFGEMILVHADQKGPLFYPVTDQVKPTAAVSRGAVA